MKKQRSNSFTRRSKKIPLNPTIYIATEGSKTEITYIQLAKELFKKRAEAKLKKRIDVNIVNTTTNTKSAPFYRLKELKKTINKGGIELYSAWLIFDMDERKPELFTEIQAWIDENKQQNHLILNAPRFEFWLKLHFDLSTSEGKTAFKDFNIDHHKVIRENDFTYEQIMDATQKARSLFTNHAELFQDVDGSEMFLLIELLARIYGLEADLKG